MKSYEKVNYEFRPHVLEMDWIYSQDQEQELNLGERDRRVVSFDC